jgi:hypothetical protein
MAHRVKPFEARSWGFVIFRDYLVGIIQHLGFEFWDLGKSFYTLCRMWFGRKVRIQGVRISAFGIGGHPD